MSDHTTQIRRRPDGSIDTAHYVQMGRAARSNTAIDACKSAVTLFERANILIGRPIKNTLHFEPVPMKSRTGIVR